MSDLTLTPESFIQHWSRAEANERANSQSFLIGLTQLLGVPEPSNSHLDGYSFEYPVKVPGGSATNFIDLYRRGCFVLESKQFVGVKPEQSTLELVAQQAGVMEQKKKSGPVRDSGAWDDAMMRAKGQAERYVRYLPAEEGNPPFILICDVGHSIEVYADFTQAGKAYLPFPDPRTFRIKLADLADETVRERLRLIWTDPAALNPARVSAEVTREIAGYLAELAKSLEAQGHDAEVVAQFLTRCLFCMFAEDVGLLPAQAFTELLESVEKDGTGFVELVGTLFKEMNGGTGAGISVVLRRKLLKFNGGLFADGTVLPVNGLQLGLLKQAARMQWRNVEPAIFGTLLERALVPEERHALGAHFTPRAYVERLVLPTVMTPLRAEWEAVRAAAFTLANKGQIKAARSEIEAFHDRLCAIRVLDPASGSGNFLYVALEHMKRLEGEVIDMAGELGGDARLDLSTHTVDPHQFLGIELNPRAASIAELVLWIGYLQWHFRTRGNTLPTEPVLRSFKNIECRDAVLAYDSAQPARDAAGQIVTVWDRRSYKTDLLTNRSVPDETQRMPLMTYSNPRPADWPEADFIVGNPPFIGTARMRDDLGDGYTETLRKAYPAVPESADFVMYWWHKAADLVRNGKARGFGLITTNSLRQTFARRVVQHHLTAEPPLSLTLAIPDHPWVDTAEGAAVRIAMTVGVAGSVEGELCTVQDEWDQEDGSCEVELRSEWGKLAADLTVGVDVTGMVPLRANEGLSNRGFCLFGSGFVVTSEKAAELGLYKNQELRRFIRPYRNGKDLTDKPRGVYVIDLFGLTVNEVRERFPETFQHVLTTVKPERDQNKRESRRLNWWVFGEPNKQLRRMLFGLPRYIATTETSKHRVFQFLDAAVRPDNKLVVISVDDPFFLGVLSSTVHVPFSTVAGSWLGVGNDSVYVKSRCFDPFPFPLCGEAEKARVREIAEALDGHRKRVQSAHPGLTLTGMYNVLEKLRAEQPLTAKEKIIHDQGLVSILLQLHDDLDAAVFDAYGWGRLWQARQDAEKGQILDFKTGAITILDCDPEGLAEAIADFERELDAEILRRLVVLNAQRAEEEKWGIVHWLRPDFQKPSPVGAEQEELGLKKARPQRRPAKAAAGKGKNKAPSKAVWPKPLAARIQAVEAALHSTAPGALVTAAELATRFARASAADLQEILDTLVALGRARAVGEGFGL
jgi:hypothetical protein